MIHDEKKIEEATMKIVKKAHPIDLGKPTSELETEIRQELEKLSEHIRKQTIKECTQIVDKYETEEAENHPEPSEVEWVCEDIRKQLSALNELE